MSGIRTGLVLLLVAGLAAAVGAGDWRGSVQRQASDFKDAIVVCRNDVMPDWVQQANISFVAMYRLKMDASGQVDEVTKLRLHENLPDKRLVGCLRQWRFPVAGQEVTVLLNWKHGAGWTSISITIPGFPTRIIRTPSYEAGDLP